LLRILGPLLFSAASPAVLVLLGALGFSKRCCCRSYAAGPSEILVAHFPWNTECVQDVSLGRLTTRSTLFDGVDRAWRNVRLFGELILGPAKGLSGGADAVHLRASLGAARGSEGTWASPENSGMGGFRRRSIGSKCLIPLGVLCP
jgi:hypothetical protein